MSQPVAEASAAPTCRRAFVAQAQRRVAAPEVVFETGDATHRPWKPHAWDATVSGLVLNFVPDPEVMAREMVRGIAVSPNNARLDQAERFPLCRPQLLQALFERVGLRSIACDDVRLAIRRRLESRLAPTPDGPIDLTARAWAVQGVA
jgi:Methyltransferase domain